MSTNCVRFSFRGVFAVHNAKEEEITPRGAKARGLLVMLAEDQGKKRSRRWLEGKLWSDRAPAQASGSLRQTLTEIRQSLGEDQSVLLSDRLSVWLDPDLIETDLDRSGTEVELLEGLDVRDPKFEQWLIEFRQRHSAGSLPSQARIAGSGIRLHYATDTEQPDLIGEIIADQIGRNIEELVSSWRVNDKVGPNAGDGDLEISCRITRENEVAVAFLKVVHVTTRRVLFSGFRKAPDGLSSLLSPDFVSAMAHDAAHHTMEKLPLAVGFTLPESVAAGFSNLALKRLWTFETDKLNEANTLMDRAYEADRNGIYLAWRGFVRMAQIVDNLKATDLSEMEEADALARKAIEVSSHNALAISLSAMTRVMLFDDVEQGTQLAEAAIHLNPNCIFARQTLAVAHVMQGRKAEGYALSRLCQEVAGTSNMRHLIDLYHSLVCISSGHLADAQKAAERAIVHCPNFVAPRRQLLALYAQSGERSKAEDQLRKLQTIEKGFSLDRYLRDQSYPVLTLRNAGLLEYPARLFG